MDDSRPLDTKWGRRASVICLCVLVLFLMVRATRFAHGATITSIELNVSDVELSSRFYVSILGFVKSDAHAISLDSSQAILGLGSETLILKSSKCRSAVSDRAPANDPSFQHIAIVVSDMDRAVEKLHAANVQFVTVSPQRLPDWNRAAAGIRAAYFRDPDGHFLELIQFPPFKGEPRWQQKDRGLFMGIDHTAIVVDDTSREIAFFRDALGMVDAGQSLNYGTEQEALSGVSGARVLITSLRGTKGAGVELLQYLAPRSSIPKVKGDRDLNDWTIRFASKNERSPLRDPDGHAIEFDSDRDAVSKADAAETFRAHWQRYLMEAAQLGAFMIATIWFTLLLEHPRSIIHRWLASPVLRRMLMGLAIGATVIVIIHSAFGVATGSHFNPAVTIAMLTLHRISACDAGFYVAAQFAGGIAGVGLASLPFVRAAAHEKVNFACTLPGERGLAAAIVAEFIISFVLFAVLLQVQDHARLKPYVAYFAGLLLFLYITFEAPLSGMSMNPARSLASAIFARRVGSTWPYFVVPIPAMTLAARLFGQ